VVDPAAPQAAAATSPLIVVVVLSAVAVFVARRVWRPRFPSRDKAAIQVTCKTGRRRRPPAPPHIVCHAAGLVTVVMVDWKRFSTSRTLGVCGQRAAY
jgi:hypothetical protein